MTNTHSSQITNWERIKSTQSSFKLNLLGGREPDRAQMPAPEVVEDNQPLYHKGGSWGVAGMLETVIHQSPPTEKPIHKITKQICFLYDSNWLKKLDIHCQVTSMGPHTNQVKQIAGLPPKN